MSNLTTVVNSIVSKINTHTTDLSNKATQISTHIPLSGITAYHLLQGNLAVSTSTITQGFNTTLYTGNGSTQSITTGIDMDTQWGNTAEEKFGGLVWLKARNQAYDNWLYDTLRGATYQMSSNQTGVNGSDAISLTSFTSNGFNVGLNRNQSATTYASWNFQTTHRVTGTTNHGKAYTCHYNPFTGFTIVKYEGSGINGHEIPHHLGRKLGIRVIKNLSGTNDWLVGDIEQDKYLFLNTTGALSTGVGYHNNSNDIVVNLGLLNTANNASSNQYIMYGWANSYIDKSNKLIGNYEIGVYQGTGASGNKVTTRGKPAWVMRKRLDAIGDWVMFDSLRTSSGNFLGRLFANTSQVEATNEDHIDVVSDGFIANYDSNISGGQYLYLVAYDTNSNGGGSYYPLASDTSNLQIQNAIIPFANGVDTNGAKITTLSKNETISGLTLTAGKNYVYSKNDGTYGVNKYEPMYGSLRNRSVAGENPDFFDVAKNKWFTTTGGAELVTNGTFDSNYTGWSSRNSATLSQLNGTMGVLSPSGSAAYAAQLISNLTIGQKYTATVSNSYGGTVGRNRGIQIRSSNESSVIAYSYITSSGTITVTFTANETSHYIYLVVDAIYANDYSYFDDVSVFEAEPTIGTEITESRNYLNHIVYADNDGSPLYVEELPKVGYIDTMQVDGLKVLSGFDLGQTWKDMTSQRSLGVTYTNNTGKPIELVLVVALSNNQTATMTLDGRITLFFSNSEGTTGTQALPHSFIIPNNGTYSITGATTITKWLELK